MMKFRTDTGVTITLPENASDLQVYKALQAQGLIRNQDFSSLDFGAYEEQITVDRKRDGKPLLTLDRVDVTV